MQTSKILVTGLAVGLLTLGIAWSSQTAALELSYSGHDKDKDTVVCYVRLEPPTLTYTLNVKYHSSLNFKPKKSRKHSLVKRQTTYSVVGKSFGPPNFGSVYGMVLVARGKGARMAFTEQMLLSNEGVFHNECSSKDALATPEHWSCKFENGFSFQLSLVDPKTAEADVVDRCGFFPAP